MTRIRVVVLLVLALSAATPGMAAAQDHLAQTTEAPAPTTAAPAPTTAAPAPTTAAPATTAEGPATTTATTATADDDDDGTSGTTWLIVVLIIVAIGLAVAALIAALSRSRAPGRTPTTVEQDARRTRIAQIVGTSRWVHDQVSLDVLGGATDAEQLRLRWQDARRRMMDLSAQAAATAAEPGDLMLRQDLQTLGQSVDNLAVALDMNVSLRTRPVTNVEQSNQALLQSSDDVSRRRAELQIATDRVAAHPTATGYS
jgi:hypothetical protein